MWRMEKRVSKQQTLLIAPVAGAENTIISAGGLYSPALKETEAASPQTRLAMAAIQTQIKELSRLAHTVEEALAREAQPDSDLFAEVARRAVPRWHFPMLNDTERNVAFVTALERLIPAGSVVLDIGSGSGLLAMVAARAGAARVYTCEENPLLAEIARQIISDHGMSDVITVLNKRSTELEIGRDLDSRVDVVVSEIVDCGLIGEGLLPTIRHAREHLLAPGGLIIPESARLHGQLVSSPAIAGLNQVHYAAGFDVSLMNVAATRGHFPVRLGGWPHELLSEPLELAAFDLTSDPLGPGRRQLPVPVTASGEAHGLATWFEMELGAGVILSNSARNATSHWMQALIPFDKPATVTAGQQLSIELNWTETQLFAK
jgi:predicted O-methyltransferase YrrM